MRTNLLWTLAVLLSGLPAQDPPTRPALATPPPAEEAGVQAAPELTPEQASALAHRAGNRPQQRVMFDRPSADGPLWALGTAWKGSFDGTGFTTIPFFGSHAPRNFPLRLELAQATVGGKALLLPAGQPVESAGTVRTARGALTEVVETRLDSLEQSFVFETLPSRGAIAVDVRITGELQPSLLDNGIRFGNEFGHVDYTKAVAIDAKGERLPLAITWTGEAAHMEIPASFVERAQLPIVLDPVLNYWFGIASGQTQYQHDSDVATIQASGIGGRTLIVYQRDYSLGDTDVWGVMFDNALNLVQTDFMIDFTSAHHTKIAVAGNNDSQNFLLVSEITGATTSYVVGRIINANASLGGFFDIERDGVVGLPGRTLLPDVGSDPYPGLGYYCVVFMKRPSTSSVATSIYYKLVAPNGTLVNATPTLVDSYSVGVDKPSISKSCGQSNGLPAYWLISWQRTAVFSPNHQEAVGRFVRWDGALIGPSLFVIAATPAEESSPSAGSPIDANGTRYWPVAYEFAATLGQPRDVFCKLMTQFGAEQAAFSVNTPIPGADDKDPEIDSDGTRFVVTRTIGQNLLFARVEAVTAAYLPASNTFRIEERTDLQTSPVTNFSQANICADFSGGNTMSPRYVISFTEEATNSFRLANFGGYATGSANLFVPQGLACGGLSISASGTPAIGQAIDVTVGNGPVSTVIFGVPGYIPLNALGCNCVLGVDQYVFFGNPMSWTVPNNPQFVGIPLAVQGFSIVGSQCLGFVDLSDSLNFVVR
ncbi:MAG: hypothetical protein MUC36_16395 [Planctomycetes bacterium]|jgi:hypothetical protein|nr:hypothetical protein [Planctomycetota bacterium]